MPSNRTTGLTPIQFADLCTRVAHQKIRAPKPTGRPRALSLGKAVKVTIMYFKNNLTQELIAELTNVSQSTISRAISHYEGPIAAALRDLVPDFAVAIRNEVTLVDGTLAPCWSWRDVPDLYSGKHKTTGHNHQVVTDITGQLLHISDPLPGATHDVKAFRDSGVADTLDLPNTIGDKGYVGTGIHTPTRKPPGGEVKTVQRECDKHLNKLRSPVERGIAHLKTWRILHTDYRRPEHTYAAAFSAVRALYFFAQSESLE